jgi:hypothetical protein
MKTFLVRVTKDFNIETLFSKAYFNCRMVKINPTIILGIAVRLKKKHPP